MAAGVGFESVTLRMQITELSHRAPQLSALTVQRPARRATAIGLHILIIMEPLQFLHQLQFF